MNEERPTVTLLSAREAGNLPDDTLYEGVPVHMIFPLQDWTAIFLVGQTRLAARIAAKLRLQVKAGQLHRMLPARHGNELLDVVDLALQLDDRLSYEVAVVGLEESSSGIMAQNDGAPEWLTPEATWPAASARARAVEQLDELLSDNGSAYTVSWPIPSCLVRRVDPTMQAAVDHAVSVAPPSAADHLREAWREAFGLHPDPNSAYSRAVKAVEEVSSPLVRPNATLGQVISNLKSGGHNWSFTLVDTSGDGTVGPLCTMLDRLWTGQVSRHGGGQRNRDQTQAEAEAAVYFAATLVQLLSTNALTRRGPAGGDPGGVGAGGGQS